MNSSKVQNKAPIMLITILSLLYLIQLHFHSVKKNKKQKREKKKKLYNYILREILLYHHS